MSRVISQPYYAWVRFTLNGVDVILDQGRPQRLISFTQELELNGIPTCTLELFDPTFHGVEKLIWAAWKAEEGIKAEWQFGHATSKGVITSPKFYGILQSYTPTWTYNGVSLSLSFQGVPPKDVYAKDKSFRDLKPCEIFKKICLELGWQIGRVDPTKGLYVPESINSTQPTLKQLTMSSQDAVSFIKNYLCVYAQRERDGKYGYKFFLDNTHSPPIASFYIPEMQDLPVSIKKVFTIRKDKLEEWIEFSYDLTLTSGEVMGVFDMVIRTANPYNGEDLINAEHADANKDKMISLEAVHHTPSPVNEPNVVRRVDATVQRTPGEAKHVQLATLGMRYLKTFKATLQIVGDPTMYVKPGDNIKIENYLPDGDLHYSSGIYRVSKVTDEISGGTHITTYELERNATPKEAQPSKNPKGES